jgi:hypothetical protein
VCSRGLDKRENRQSPAMHSPNSSRSAGVSADQIPAISCSIALTSPAFRAEAGDPASARDQLTGLLPAFEKRFGADIPAASSCAWVIRTLSAASAASGSGEASR